MMFTTRTIGKPGWMESKFRRSPRWRSMIWSRRCHTWTTNSTRRKCRGATSKWTRGTSNYWRRPWQRTRESTQKRSSAWIKGSTICFTPARLLKKLLTLISSLYCCIASNLRSVETTPSPAVSFSRASTPSSPTNTLFQAHINSELKSFLALAISIL